MMDSYPVIASEHSERGNPYGLLRGPEGLLAMTTEKMI